MDKKQFEKMIKEYKKGTLSEKENIKFEEELDKFDAYQDYLDDEDQITDAPHNPITNEASTPNSRLMKSLNKGKRKAIFTNAVITLSLILMILPICAVFTFTYYGYGIKDSHGNRFLEVVEDTIAITEPNTLVDISNVRDEIKLFSMTGHFDLYKQIGHQESYIRTEELTLWFNSIDQPKRIKKIKNEDKHFVHPNELTVSNNDIKTTLQNLPNGTVSEVYISLDSMYDEEEVKKLFDNIDLEILWYAVDTGFENEVNGKAIYSPIGYPAKPGNINSSFNDKEENQKQFLDVLDSLNEYEDWTEKIAINELNIKDKANYIQNNGIGIYGVVVTGPTKELLKVNDIKAVTSQYLGGVELWNWR